MSENEPMLNPVEVINPGQYSRRQPVSRVIPTTEPFVNGDDTILSLVPVQRGSHPVIHLENDVLGLVEHNRPQDEIARQIGNGLSYICEQIANTNPEVRRAMLEDRTSVDFPEIHLGKFHSFRLRRAETEDGGVVYEMHRTDIGAPEPSGGFFAIAKDNETCVIRRDLETHDEQSAEYNQILAQAASLMNTYASEHNIPKSALESQQRYIHMQPDKVDGFIRTAKKESTRRHRLLSEVRNSGSVAIDRARKLITVETDDNLARELSRGRIAVAVCLFIIPVFGDDIYRVGKDIFVDDPTEDPLYVYDRSELDIPGAAAISMDGESHDLQSVSPMSEASEFDPITFTGTVDEVSGDALMGESPRVVDLQLGELPVGECFALRLDQDIADQASTLASTNPRVDGITVTRTQSSMLLCNDGEQTVETSEIDLLFDTVNEQ